MRTTLTLDDEIAALLKEEAHRANLPMKQVVNEAIRAGLSRAGRRRPKRYRLKTAHLGGPLPGIDLDRALRLSDALEDAEIARKLELKK
jgi:hypothetical protein